MKNIFTIIALGLTLLFVWQVNAIPETSMCTMEYAPVCGEPLVTCPEWALCQRALPQTYSNKCMLTAENARYLHAGECEGEWKDYNIKDDEPELPEATDTRYYVWNSKMCTIIKYSCEENWDYYYDDIWCGCEKEETISVEMRDTVDNLLEKFIQKLENKNYSDKEIRGVMITISLRLERMKELKPQYKDLIVYTLSKIKSYK